MNFLHFRLNLYRTTLVGVHIAYILKLLESTQFESRTVFSLPNVCAFEQLRCKRMHLYSVWLTFLAVFNAVLEIGFMTSIIRIHFWLQKQVSAFFSLFVAYHLIRCGDLKVINCECYV